MYTISIDDPNVYLRGETFAKEHNSSLKELVNKYVSNLAAKASAAKPQENESALSEAEKFQKALAYVKSLTTKGGKSVPANIEPMDVFVEIKYKQ